MNFHFLLFLFYLAQKWGAKAPPAPSPARALCVNVSYFICCPSEAEHETRLHAGVTKLGVRTKGYWEHGLTRRLIQNQEWAPVRNKIASIRLVLVTVRSRLKSQARALSA